MPKRDTEEDHLAEADRHIAAAEQRIASLKQQIEAMRTKGADTTTATELLTIMRGALVTMRAHRHGIVSALLTLHSKRTSLPPIEEED